jgi:hypothetical protein
MRTVLADAFPCAPTELASIFLNRRHWNQIFGGISIVRSEVQGPKSEVQAEVATLEVFSISSLFEQAQTPIIAEDRR